MRRVVAISLLIILNFSRSQAQLSKIDSLQKQLLSAKNDTDKVLMLNNLSYSLRESNLEKALEYSKLSKNLSEKIHFVKGLPYALENLGWIYYRKGIYTKAFELSSQALAICERIGDEKEGARCLNTIAAIYFVQKKYKLVISTLKSAIKISKRINDNKNVIRSMNNLAYVYSNQDSLKNAIFYSNQALKNAEKCEDKYLIASTYGTNGDILLKQKKLEDALSYFKNSLNIAEQLNSNFLISLNLNRIGDLYLKQEKIEKAFEYFNRNISFSQKNGFKEELEKSYKLQSEAYSKLKNYSKAYYYLNLHVSLHDSLYSYQNAQQLALFENDMDNQMKQNQFKLLKQDDLIKEKTIAQQQMIIYSALFGTVLFAVVIFLLTYSNRQKQAINDLLSDQKQEITSKADHLKEIDTVKNKLFSILAHDLRSSFYSIQGLLNLLDSDDLTKDEMVTVGLHLKQSVSFTNTMLDNILHWAKSQMQGSFTKKEQIFLKEFSNTKINFIKNSASIKNIKIVNNIPTEISVFADSDQLDLILRNLFSNALKFTPNLGTITISAIEKDGLVEISIKDNGIGIKDDILQKIFKTESYFSSKGTEGEKGTGLGLVLCKEFVEKNGGKIWVESNSDQGSTFTFTLISRLNK